MGSELTGQMSNLGMEVMEDVSIFSCKLTCLQHSLVHTGVSWLQPLNSLNQHKGEEPSQDKEPKRNLKSISGQPSFSPSC